MLAELYRSKPKVSAIKTLKQKVGGGGYLRHETDDYGRSVNSRSVTRS
jgi:hypothetical protein